MTTRQPLSLPSRYITYPLVALLLLAVIVSGVGCAAKSTSINRTGADATLPAPTLQFVEIAPTFTPTAAPMDTVTPMDTPAPSIAPTCPPPAQPDSSLLQVLQTAHQNAIAQRDKEKLEAILLILDEAMGMGQENAAALSDLQESTAFALDVMQGSYYLDSSKVASHRLVNSLGQPLVQPIDMSLSADQIYIIDSGTLYQAPLPTSLAPQEPLTLTTILTPTALIDGFPVKEIVAVDATNLSYGVAVLDKSNDIFIYDLASVRWSLHRPQASGFSRPEPHFLNLATYADRLYLLDTSRNQIWRYPPTELGAAYLNSNLLWLQPEGGPDVTQGIDLAIDGAVYVLNREGEIAQYAPDLVNTFSLDVAEGKTHFSEWEQLSSRPLSLSLADDDIAMYVADPPRRRIVVLDRRDGSFLRQFIFADNPEFDRLHSAIEKDGVLYMMAGNQLYAYPLPEPDSASADLLGTLPELAAASWDLDGVTLAEMPPNDPRVPSLLSRYQLAMPNPGKVLPDQFVLYPGARRAYRYGVHQGMDLYYEAPDQRAVIGSPVLAAGAGVVIRADVDYQEMTLDEVNALLADAHARHITPADTLDKLGGRQIWIDHGDGLITKYEHLSAIADGLTVGTQVEKGQLIGQVGLSGTPDGIEGNLDFPHLHFEIRFGPDHAYYLGQWLTIEDTRRILESLFAADLTQSH